MQWGSGVNGPIKPNRFGVIRLILSREVAENTDERWVPAVQYQQVPAGTELAIYSL